jgi:hypothetical protein
MTPDLAEHRFSPPVPRRPVGCQKSIVAVTSSYRLTKD